MPRQERRVRGRRVPAEGRPGATAAQEVRYPDSGRGGPATAAARKGRRRLCVPRLGPCCLRSIPSRHLLFLVSISIFVPFFLIYGKKNRTRRRPSPLPLVDHFDPARRPLCLHTTFCFPNDMINESGDTTLLRAIDDNVFLLFGYKWLRASVCVCNGFSRSPCCQSSKLSIIVLTRACDA